jgi:deoxyribose-phosphate aldolase
MLPLVVASTTGPLARGSDRSGRIAFRQGGSAANTARWVAAAGGDAVFIGAVGRDDWGRRLMATLEGCGVRTHLVAKRAQTALIVALVEPGGERTFVTDRGAADLLSDSEVNVASVVGFPLGSTLTSIKRYEAVEVLRLGASELDMVIDVGAMKDGAREDVYDDIEELADVAHQSNAILKVILENCLLSDEQKVEACEIAMEAGADFVKTSTGFNKSGATVGDVELMRRIVGDKLGVKAAGGIRTAADAIAMINAGANRIGASASVAIVKELGAE